MDSSKTVKLSDSQMAYKSVKYKTHKLSVGFIRIYHWCEG